MFSLRNKKYYLLLILHTWSSDFFVPKAIAFSNVKQTSAKEKRRFILTSGFRQYNVDYTVANFLLYQSDVALPL